MTPDEQFRILSRDAEEILPAGELAERLREGRPLRVKQGFDPTAPDIHLGHTVGLRKLLRFQQLRHQVVLIIGDYTGIVGDPSGRSKTRPQLSRAEVEENSKTYLEQFFRVLERDPKPPLLPVEVHRNGEWFAGMGLLNMLELAGKYTVSQLLERDDFSERYRSGQPIGIHELFYPLMQGYDSVEVRADLEIGATEQKFNLLVGREMQRLHGQRPQVILTLPVLPGLDGVQRMSKSLGNYVGITDPPSEMFGKVMSLPDAVMPLYWRLAADLDERQRAEVERDLADPAVNPMTVKKRLAGRIVALYHGVDRAARAQHDFEAQFSRREVPEHLEEFGRRELMDAAADAGKPFIVDALVASGISTSRTAARRLVQQGAVTLDGKPVHAWDTPVDPDQVHVLRGGRKMKRYVPVPGADHSS